jgi:hypothetical protein
MSVRQRTAVGPSRRADLGIPSLQGMQEERVYGDYSAGIQSAVHDPVPNATGLANTRERLLDEAIEVEAEVIRVLLLAFDAQLRAQVEAIKEFLQAFDAQLGVVPRSGDRLERMEERVARLEERAELILRYSVDLLSATSSDTKSPD